MVEKPAQGCTGNPAPGLAPVSVNLTAGGAREPALAGVIMWPTAKALGKEAAEVAS